MKMKYLMTALLVAMLAGCASSDDQELQKEPTGQTAERGKTEVSFSAYASRGVTRSGWAGNLLLAQLQESQGNGGGFGVFGYYTDLKKYDQTYVPNFMYNQGVFYNNVSTNWEYSPVVYWPNEYGSFAQSDDEDKVSFFAYAPYVAPTSAASGSVEDATYGITGFSRNTAAGDPLVKYIASFDSQKSVDLCWGVVGTDDTTWGKIQGGGAQAMTAGLPWLDVEHPQSTGQKMKFTFKHALAQLNVQIDADPDITAHNTTSELDANTKIYVRSISFTGIALKGALNLNNSEANRAQWLDYSGTTDLPYGESVTVKDGRRDGREGAAGAEANNEIPAGLNPQIIQNSTATTGVIHTYQNLFNPGTTGTDDEKLARPVYVIPTGEAMTISIVYDVETVNTDLTSYLSDGATHGVSVENKITKTIAFNDVEGLGMESGKKYTLKLHLGMNSMKFNASVDEWDETNYNGNGWLPGNAAARLSITAPTFSTPAPSRRMTRGFTGDGPVTVDFENGDAMGLYVMTPTGAKQSNIKVTYNGAGWSTDAPVPYDPSYTYYLYHPYQSTAPTTLTVGGASADDFFATMISGWTPADDQSTREKLMNQMLMVAKGSVSGSAPDNYVISFAPENKMSLIKMSDHKYELDGDASYTWEYLETDVNASNQPYVDGTKLYYVAKGGATVNVGGAKSVTAAAAGNVKVDAITATTHTLAVGDLMCDDGSLWTNKAAITAQNTASGTSLKPIGIVFKTGISDNGFTHGYVMSLTEDGLGYQWSASTMASAINTCIPSTGGVTVGVGASSDWDQTIAIDMAGLDHSKGIWAAGDASTYPAAYRAKNFSPAAPEGTSGWYLPSIGQMYTWLTAFCSTQVSASPAAENNNPATSRWVYWGGKAKAAKDDINDYLTGKGLTAGVDFSRFLGGNDAANDGVTWAAYWSSTERVAGYPFRLRFGDNGNLNLHGYYASTSAYRVRPVFAF